MVFFKDDQIMVLAFGKELPLGEVVLRMHFNGTLNDDMKGFYRRYELFLSFIFLDISILFESCMHARKCIAQAVYGMP